MSGKKERIFNDAYIDLGVKVSNTLTEIYEVKASADRQVLYTAIGQILVHSVDCATDIQRYLVIPLEGAIPHDITRTLRLSQIKVLRFELTKVTVRILGHG